MEEKLDQTEDTVSSTRVKNTKNQTDNASIKNQDERSMDEMIGRLQEEDDKFNDGEPSAEQNGAIHGFRQSMLDYIKDAANPKLSLKLMKASKYFCFHNFPYFPIKSLRIAENDEMDGIEWYYEKLDGKEYVVGDDSNYDAIPQKLWITKVLYLCEYPDGLLQIIPRIAVFDLKHMFLTGIDIFFDDFLKLMALGCTY
uniref:Uncharacterized protein n=1 Tax=Panagrolaimus sp. ES5 TaxID=591445 RepID=A0AC34GGY8_9BILA